MFVPTDEALAANPAYTIEDILEEAEAAQWLVNYHITAGESA